MIKEIETKSANRDYDGANWNSHEDNFTQTFYEQNLSQFWRPEDISLQPDLNLWATLSPEIRKAYSQNLAVLTFLDTYQGDIGMPVVSRSIDDKFHQRKAVLNFMAAMENAVHAKSYSNIFMTYLQNDEIDDMFSWTENHKNMQRLLALIVGYYEDLDRLTYRRRYDNLGDPVDEQEFRVAQWKAMVASVFLESCLFYSGFYYPLYFYGQGKLMQAGEIINLILRDESIHGLYIGNLSMEIYNSFDKPLQAELYQWLTAYLDEIYKEEVELIESIYDAVDLSHDVKIFVRYNANKAMMNLGFDPYYDYEEVNPVVLNGLNTETKTMDNFSMKGNGYQKMKSESLSDDDFHFDAPRIKR